MTPSKTIYDVAVVGAGPSGASAAWHLATAGLNVIILEKQHWPREKTCGGGVVARALAEIPPEIPLPVLQQCHKANININDISLSYTATRKKPIVSMVMRSAFDEVMVNAAIGKGATFRDHIEVTGIGGCANHMTLRSNRENIPARMIIAADGVNSLIARQQGFKDIKVLAPAIEWEIAYDKRLMRQFENIARFDFGILDDGYAWIFPKRESLSVGLGTMRAKARNLPGTLSCYLEGQGIMADQSTSRKGHLIPLSPRPGMLAKGRTLLVGDAAGLVDPVTAEGITFALQSGRLAAEAIISGQLEPSRVPYIYQNELQNSLLKELFCGRLLATILYRTPRLRNRFFIRHGQRLAERMADLVMGKTTYCNILTQGSFWSRMLGFK